MSWDTDGSILSREGGGIGVPWSPLGAKREQEGPQVPEYRKKRMLPFQMAGKNQCSYVEIFTPGQPCPVSHAWCRYYICLLPVSTRSIFMSVVLEAFPYLFRPTIKWLSFELSLHFICISHCVNSGKLLNLSEHHWSHQQYRENNSANSLGLS